MYPTIILHGLPWNGILGHFAKTFDFFKTNPLEGEGAGLHTNLLR